MNKNKKIIGIIIVLAIIVILVIMAGGNQTVNDNGNATTVDTGLDTATTTPGEAINPDIATLGEILDDAAKLIKRKKYQQALDLLMETQSLTGGDYQRVQLFTLLHQAYDGLEQYHEAALALGEVAVASGGRSTPWIDFLEYAQGQAGFTIAELDSMYNDALSALGASGKADNPQLVNIYTTYSRFLAWTVGDFQGAIDYLKLAIDIDPERANIFNAEITDLEKELSVQNK
ncbi:MAG: hypothetical protein OEX08_03000 [Candidatus Nomurabacteria bacterium]|nr:hypothetical protein [Candidatus Nomurabacteria bacterium]